MFHHTRKLLTKSYLGLFSQLVFVAVLVFSSIHATTAGEEPNHSASFNPSKGFKPAQSDLTEVFLQLAGSLEYYGTPEPYLRHMKAEHARIEAKYQQQLGKQPRKFCPGYMDDAYFDRFAVNWKQIAPQLGLESLVKTTGRLMRAAIDGPDGKGTVLINVFNQHQREVYAAMTSKNTAPIPDFEVLRASMVKCLQLDDTAMPTGNLTTEQQAAVNPANEIRTAFLKLFSALDAGLSVPDAEKVKTAIRSIFTDVGNMAQSELKVAMAEDSLDELRTPQAPYSTDQEKALNADERQTLRAFLKKARFTRDDLPALDKFYSTIYDKLSKRGKLEMHYRLQAGMHPRQ